MEQRTCLGWQEDPMRIIQEAFHYVSVNSADIFQEALWKWIIRFILVCMHLHFPFLQNVSRFFLAYIIAVLLLYLYLIDLASSRVLFSGLELVFSILLSYSLNSKSFWFLWLHLSPLWISSNSLRPVCISALTPKDNLGQEHHESEEGWSLRPVCISALTLKDSLGQEHHGSEEGSRSFT